MLIMLSRYCMDVSQLYVERFERAVSRSRTARNSILRASPLHQPSLSSVELADSTHEDSGRPVTIPGARVFESASAETDDENTAKSSIAGSNARIKTACCSACLKARR